MKTTFFQLFFCSLLLVAANLHAQSPVSGFMQGKGSNVTAISYSYEQYNDVFLVPADIKGVPVFDEVSIQSYSIYNATGLGENLDLVVGLPYISAEGQASEGVLQELGYSNTRKGLQDVSVYLKYRPVSIDMDGCRLDFLVSGGIKTPLGDYRADEGLQSIIAIGNRATSVTAIGGAHFMTNSGLFATTQIGYSLRSDRVPNALIGELKVGYAAEMFYVDAWLAGQTSDGGTNILAEGFDGFFPATDVSYHRAGANVFVPVGAGFGIGAGVNSYISGRNIGKATGFTAAITYTIP